MTWQGTQNILLLSTLVFHTESRKWEQERSIDRPTATGKADDEVRNILSSAVARRMAERVPRDKVQFAVGRMEREGGGETSEYALAAAAADLIGITKLPHY